MSERGLADTGCFQQPVVCEKQESDCCGGSLAGCAFIKKRDNAKCLQVLIVAVDVAMMIDTKCQKGV